MKDKIRKLYQRSYTFWVVYYILIMTLASPIVLLAVPYLVTTGQTDQIKVFIDELKMIKFDRWRKDIYRLK